MEIELYKGGIDRVMLMGVPKLVAVIELMIGLFCVLALHSFYVIPFIIAIHAVLVHLYKKDQYYLEILFSHMREDDYLEP